MDTPAYAQCDVTVARGLVNSLTSTPRGNDVRCSLACFFHRPNRSLTPLRSSHVGMRARITQSFYDPVSIKYYTGTVGS